LKPKYILNLKILDHALKDAQASFIISGYLSLHSLLLTENFLDFHGTAIMQYEPVHHMASECHPYNQHFLF